MHSFFAFLLLPLLIRISKGKGECDLYNPCSSQHSVSFHPGFLCKQSSNLLWLETINSVYYIDKFKQPLVRYHRCWLVFFSMHERLFTRKTFPLAIKLTETQI